MRKKHAVHKSVEKFLFEEDTQRRWTQDSPILPEVWLHFADLADKGKRDERVDLLITPYDGADGLEIAQNLELEGAEVAFISNFVVARVTYAELIEKVLPLTEWWCESSNKKLTRRDLSNPQKRKWIENISKRLDISVEYPEHPKTPLIWQIGINREATLALYDSVCTTKADAARRLFSVNCEKIGWAVIDDGIDAHLAFQDRVKARYDFTEIRSKLNAKNKHAIRAGRSIDWKALEEDIKIAGGHKKKIGEHGTHVAGILGAAQPDNVGEEKPLGLCPDIKLYDIRAFNEKGSSDEFTILAALQFIRYLNDKGDKPVIHGANLSFSIPHNVRDFACGATPVCRECDKLVASGVVTVVAAGNYGYKKFVLSDGARTAAKGGYDDMSITDPGNADSVITVGATHRKNPHTYGVSYFSSRGPTGDGRIKPDLIAPGEKITSTVPGQGYKVMDGTSMAAPHVSGIAAMLLARYPEFIGKPQRVKQILMDTATDLNREKYFQGAGLVDALRALQSV